MQSVTQDPVAEREIIGALCGDVRPPADDDAFVAMARAHGVAGLLVERRATGMLRPAAAGPLTRDAHRQLATWAVRHRELQALFSDAADASIDLLLIKGAHLAYAFYGNPAARGSHDVDLYVRPSQRERFAALARARGYVESAATTGDAALGQAVFQKAVTPGMTLDVHTRLLTVASAASALSFDALWSRSESLPALNGIVRVPHVTDALLIAVLHQAVHHRHQAVLLWMFDVHLLLAGLSAHDLNAFVDRAIATALAPAHAYPLVDAQERFPCAQGDEVLRSLRARGALTDTPPAVDGPARQMLTDIVASPTWGSRARLARGHLFPPAAYMRQTYAPGSTLPLAVLYALRAARGVRKWW